MSRYYHDEADAIAAAQLDWANATHEDKAEFWAGYEAWLDSLPSRQTDSAGQIDCCPQYTDQNGNLRRLKEPKSNGNINGIEI